MAKWNYELKTGKALRKAIQEENYRRVVDLIIKSYKELRDHGFIDDYDFERYTEDFDWFLSDIESDDFDVENIDYELDNLYDLCDEINVWIPIG